MPKSRKTKKSRESEKRKRRREMTAEPGAGLQGKTRETREDRHVLVALVMASLIAGLLFVINCDRSTNAAAALEKGRGTSLHGWPLIYLERHFESLPEYLMHTRENDWPIPAVKGEVRTMNYRNLVVDFLCCGVIVLICYFVIRAIVYRYDQWKLTRG